MSHEKVVKNYNEMFDFLNSSYDEINGVEFYQSIFPHNQNEGELTGDYSRPNAIYLYEDPEDKDSKRKLRRRIMINDTWENDFIEYVEENPMTLCSGLTYRGRANKLEKAQQLNALIVDLDSVGLQELNILFSRFDLNPEYPRTLPKPTYVSLSGSGLHLYYVLEEPVDLFPNIKDQFRELKHMLTFRIWEYKETTKEENIQYQGINQGFRMVGSQNNKYNLTIKVFKTGERVSVDYLNSYCHDVSKRVELSERFFTEHTLEEAKMKFPEWYQKVIVEGNKKRKHWIVKRDLYDWWKRKIPEVKGGHRYYYLMVLVIYAIKCNIPKKEVEKDLYELFEVVKKVNHSHALTEYDIESALDVYDPAYHNFPVDVIVEKTGIKIEKNRRNYRTQEQHLKIARATRDIVNPNWRDGNGRPSKENIVKEWQLLNPTGTKAQCIRDTGLSKMTVYKWWNDNIIQYDEEELIDIQGNPFKQFKFKGN